MSERQGPDFVMGPAGEPLSFSAFILGLASTTLIHLGVHPNPETGGVAVDLELARQSIDALDLLRQKTRGNLTEDEDRLFASVLADVRLRFVEQQNAKRS